MSRFTGFLQRVKEMISESCGLRLLFNNEDNKYWYHNTVCLSHKPLNKWHCENKFPFISSSVLIVCVQSLCSKHKVIWISRGSPRSLGTNENISISRSSVVVAPHLCFCVGWQFILLCLESTCSGDFQGWYMRRVKKGKYSKFHVAGLVIRRRYWTARDAHMLHSWLVFAELEDSFHRFRVNASVW